MQNLMVQLIANGTSTLRSGIAEMPFWAEEVAIIVAIAVVFIIIHHSLTFIVKECRGGKGKMLDEEPVPFVRSLARPSPWLLAQRFYGTNADSAMTRRVPPPPAQAATHTPKTSRELPGVTDRRFTGVIVSYKPEEGYGFIQCPELHEIFCRDVFLHRLQIGRFDVGASVSFGVFLNKNCQPQAKEVALPLRITTDGVAAPPDTPGFAAHGIRRLPTKPLLHELQQQQRCNDFVADSPMSPEAAANLARHMQGRPMWEELMTSQPTPSEAMPVSEHTFKTEGGWRNRSASASLANDRATGELRSIVRNRGPGTATAY